MDSHEIIKEQLLQVVENQLNLNDPPETKATLGRLLGLGIEDEIAKLMIADCIQIQMKEMFRDEKVFNSNRFSELLDKLPGNPYED